MPRLPTGLSMSKIVAVENDKGGCGKTTTAYNLATDLKSRNYTVALIDNDPQKGSVRWKQGSLDPEKTPMVVPIENPLTKNDIEFANTLDFLIIDGAPGFGNDKRLKSSHDLLHELLHMPDDEISPKAKTEIKGRIRKIFGFDGTIAAKLSAAIKLADLVIIPTIPSIQDLEPTLNMIDRLLIPHKSIHNKPDYKVLLTSSGEKTKLYDSVINTLKAQNIPYFNSPIVTREIYRQSTTGGFTVIDAISGNQKAKQETQNATNEVLEYFGMPTHKEKEVIA